MNHLVLVVDDTPQNLLVASRHLEAAGYRVASASSGEQALGYLEKEQPDLIILDVLMPGLGGFETCRRIRAMQRIAEVPVLFMTALGDRDATTPALEAGADDLLAKPFARSELLLRARALIRQRAQAASRRDRLRAAIARLREIARTVEGDAGTLLRGELENLTGCA